MMRLSVVFGVLAAMASACSGSDLSEGTKPEFKTFVDGEPVPDRPTVSGEANLRHEFARLDPGTGATARADMKILNNGGKPVRVTKVLLLATNSDSTPKSPWIKLDWGVIDPSRLFCTGDVDGTCGKELTQGQIIEFQVTYSPEKACSEAGNCEAQATLQIWHNDPAVPSPMVVEFGPPLCSRVPRVTPPSDTFFNASKAKPERKTFTITNQGTCGCAVNDVALNVPNSKFRIDRSFTNGTELGKDDELTFEVTYTPTDEAADDSATINVSFDCLTAPIKVQLKTQSETGTYKLSYDNDENGFLDFTQTTAGCDERVVSLYNEGPSSMQVQGWVVPEDPEGQFYTLTCVLPPNVEGAEPVNVPKPPAGLAASRSIECTVKYCAATQAGKNGTVIFTYANPSQGTIEIPVFGGQPKSCFEYAPGDTTTDTPIFFYSAGKGASADASFVVYNCGNADLTVNAVRIDDAFLPGNPSKYFNLVDAPTFPLVLPVGSLHEFPLRMIVDDESKSVDATLYVDYNDPQGNPITGFGRNLIGNVASAVEPPVAVLELVGDAKKGETLTLTGTNSTGSVADAGYLFYLVAKPAGSATLLNGPASGSAATVVPDVAGTYTFALVVFSDVEPYLYSHAATLDVDVVE